MNTEELNTMFIKNFYHKVNIISWQFLLKQMDENIAISGGVAYFAEHFAHKKYNFIWKMPSVLLADSITLQLQGETFLYLFNFFPSPNSFAKL